CRVGKLLSTGIWMLKNGWRCIELRLFRRQALRSNFVRR
ncbi:nucleotidyltransferase domain protein, partial [Vibrio parahaemolyticus V-223/04]